MDVPKATAELLRDLFAALPINGWPENDALLRLNHGCPYDLPALRQMMELMKFIGRTIMGNE
jgi:hypothetical protein